MYVTSLPRGRRVGAPASGGATLAVVSRQRQLVCSRAFLCADTNGRFRRARQQSLMRRRARGHSCACARAGILVPVHKRSFLCQCPCRRPCACARAGTLVSVHQRSVSAPGADGHSRMRLSWMPARRPCAAARRGCRDLRQFHRRQTLTSVYTGVPRGIAWSFPSIARSADDERAAVPGAAVRGGSAFADAGAWSRPRNFRPCIFKGGKACVFLRW